MNSENEPTPLAFEIGEIVQLKSGGPGMTVTDIDGRCVYVAWFTRENGEHPQRGPWIIERSMFFDTALLRPMSWQN
jgi:uncharacterized protein YodC (DUF2158 family)